MNDFWKDCIVAVIIVILTIILNKVLDKLINRIILKRSNKQLTTVLIFVKRIKSVAVYTIGILIAVAQFSVLSSFSITVLSALGIFAGVIGFAGQEVLSNFFGSLELVMSKPFEVGDFIKIPELNLSGTVEEISTRHTILKTINNQREILPNSSLNKLAIENFDFVDNEIVLFADYKVSYNSDLDKAIDIIKEELVNICKVNFKGDNKNIEFPRVRTVEWGSSGINIRAWVWGNDTGEAYENMWELNYRLKRRFDEEKIEIPYDYVNVIMKK